MALKTIVSTRWVFGNGTFSNLPSPTAFYKTGVYDVQVELTFDDGSTQLLSESEYILVTEDNQNMFDEGYLQDPKSYHYGFNKEIAGGWSKNSGDNWVWPESMGAISQIDLAGINYLLVWDMYDDKEYWVNTRNTASTDVEYLDKGTYVIPGDATLKGATASSKANVIKHLESIVKVSTDVDSGSLPVGVEVDLGIIVEEGGNVIETNKNITSGSETTFKETSLSINGESNMQQLKISTNMSEVNILGIESRFKSIAKQVSAANPADESSDVFLATKLAYWATTSDYAYDLWTGTATGVAGSLIDGPVETSSAILLSSDLTCSNAEQASGSVMLMYVGTQPVISGVALIDYGTVNGFTCAYYNGLVPASMFIPSTNTIFDVRIFSENITTSTLDDYKANITRFIPGA